MSNYEPVIGLEVHIELNTKTKMFCRCSADYFGKESNTHTCPVCLGLPGALPIINEEALEKCAQIGLALDCKIAEKSLFERKNYFYPDLSKGYQISQYRWPLCVNGHLTLADGQKIRINRVHQEEDTGKLTHSGKDTLIDFNRSGMPLVEIVTEPDFKNSEQIKDYAQKLQQMFRYLGVSNADMERGDMRLEANISVRPVGQQELPVYRVELKNINSFRFMVAAVEYEIKRQIEAIEKGEKITQETRGWDEDKKSTYVQRSKEEANDYRYFPEPDLPLFFLSKEKIHQLQKSLPALPWNKSKIYENEYQIKSVDAQILTADKDLAQFFESTVKLGKEDKIDPKEIANYIINKKIDYKNTSSEEVLAALKAKSVGVIETYEELEKIAKEVIEENPEFVDTYKKGKTNVIMALVGGVMKKTSGKANAQKVRQILEDLLKE